MGRALTERKEVKVLVSVGLGTGRGKVGVCWTAESSGTRKAPSRMTIKVKEKSLSQKQRKTRKAGARKRVKIKRDVLMMTSSDNLIMKFRRLPEN